MAELAMTLGRPLRMGKRETADAEIPVPAMVHWKAGHFAALVRRDGGRYLVQDPTFGDELWVSRRALEEEATGYFLVEELPAGWRPVEQSEGADVWGKGVTYQNNPENTKQCSRQTSCGGSGGFSAAGGGTSGSSCSPGMAQHTIHLAVVSLHLVDTCSARQLMRRRVSA